MTDHAAPPPGTPAPSPAGAEGPALAPRRRALLALLATAGLAGAGLAWWRLSPSEPPVDPALWQQRLPRPEGGGELVLAELRGRPLILNFWATWCPPCVQELPLLDRFFAEHRASGWQVAALAVDQPAQVARFLRHTPLRFPVAMASASLARELGNPAGGLPFTVVFDADGSVIARKRGRLHPADLARWLAHEK